MQPGIPRLLHSSPLGDYSLVIRHITSMAPFRIGDYTTRELGFGSVNTTAFISGNPKEVAQTTRAPKHLSGFRVIQGSDLLIDPKRFL